MEINFLDLDENRPYYESEIWKDGEAESRYFETLKEARADQRRRSTGNAADCIKHHKGERFLWTCEIVK